MKNKWTFNGIKRFYPSLTIEGWLKICNRNWHFNRHPDDVVKGIITEEKSLTGIDE